MPSKPYLLFDAGGTIVFPDQSFLIKQAQVHGLTLTHKQLYTGYYRLIYNLDCQAHHRKDYEFFSFKPENYAYRLFETLEMVNPVTDAVAQAFYDQHLKKKSLWTFTFDWIPKTLSILVEQGYRMSILSNSDGRTEELFRELDLVRYFEYIFDSLNLGVEKPDPIIFKKVLDNLNLSPVNVIYIGDMFYVDVFGANQTGLGGIHFDPLGNYADWRGVHLPDLRHLPAWLDRYSKFPSSFDLYPFPPKHHQAPTSHSYENPYAVLDQPIWNP